MVWYYAKDGVRQGPVEEPEFDRLVGQGIVRSDTLVWCEGMPDWRSYSAVSSTKAPAPIPDPVTVIEPVPAAAAVEVEAPMATASVPASNLTASEPEARVTQLLNCTQCQRPYPSEELVRFGAATICANCKEIYAQRLRETGHVAGARIYGGFWIRYLALIIDGIVQAIPVLAIMIPMMFAATSSSSRITDIVAMSRGIWINLLSFCIGLLYESFFLVQYGATPGKMVLNLKVVTADGGRLSWGRAIGRHLAARYLSTYMTLFIGCIVAGFDSEKRALHDHIAGTRVIRNS